MRNIIIPQQGQPDDTIHVSSCNSRWLCTPRGQIKLMSEDEENNWCGTERKSHVVCVYFSTWKCLLSSAKPFCFWDILSKAKEEEEKKALLWKNATFKWHFLQFTLEKLCPMTPLWGGLLLNCGCSSVWCWEGQIQDLWSFVAYGFSFGHFQINFFIWTVTGHYSYHKKRMCQFLLKSKYSAFKTNLCIKLCILLLFETNCYETNYPTVTTSFK